MRVCLCYVVLNTVTASCVGYVTSYVFDVHVFDVQ